jgi:mRNA interferase MazF
MDLVGHRFDVFLVALDPTVGHEIKKTRPALVISPDEVNEHLSTLIIAPMTTKGSPYPTRIPCRFQGKQGQIVLDQIRTIDRARLVRRLGRISPSTQRETLAALGEMFAE